MCVFQVCEFASLFLRQNFMCSVVIFVTSVKEFTVSVLDLLPLFRPGLDIHLTLATGFHIFILQWT